jgi:hypothetical protein
MLAVRLANMLEFDYDTTAPWRLSEVEVYPLHYPGNRNPLNLVQLLDTALHLRSLGVLGPKALDETHLPLDFYLLSPGGCLASLDIFLAGENVAIIVSMVKDNSLILNSYDLADNIVEKGPVM